MSASSHALPARVALSTGVELALVDFGGEGPLCLLHHASGFCAVVWRRIAERLRMRYRVLGYDARGHGDSSGGPSYTWRAFADDLGELGERVCAALGHERVALCAGHSLGGTAAVLAALQAPALFERLVLIDPVLVSAELAAEMAVRPDGSTTASLSTRMRQAVFASHAEARALWASQALYRDFQPDVLEDYLQGSLRLAADGRLQLKCSPRIEASIYALGETRGVFAPLVPPALLLSALGSRFAAGHERLALAAPGVELRRVAAGHLMPMEQPDLIVQAIEGFAGASTSA